MARKVYYSKPLKYFWEHLYGVQKKLTPDFTDEQIFYLLKQNLLTIPIGNGETQEERRLMISGLELWRKDSIGEILHIFFLDKQLRDFLEKTPLSDIDGIKKFLYENGQNTEVFHLYSKKTTQSVVYNFALHLPYEPDGYAFSLSIEEDGSVELYFSIGENNGLMADKFYADVNKKDDEISLIQSKIFRLAVNTIAYMNCFPDCVTDGVPNNLLVRSEDTSAKNFTFQISEKIKEIDNSQLSKIPHFRKGHFRRLQSDYFTNKKGQLIFVTETMVKGKAKTVSTSSEIENFTRNATQ
jgi:sulfur transfer complex TusBCD TusB component (DsrH family)